jgi:hypothetical protein
MKRILALCLAFVGVHVVFIGATIAVAVLN